MDFLKKKETVVWILFIKKQKKKDSIVFFAFGFKRVRMQRLLYKLSFKEKHEPPGKARCRLRVCSFKGYIEIGL